MDWSLNLFNWWPKPDIGIMVKVFANGPGDLGSIPGRVIPKTQKMVLDATLLNTQHYKVRIKSKVEQFNERSCALPDTLLSKREPSGYPRLRSPTSQQLTSQGLPSGYGDSNTFANTLQGRPSTISYKYIFFLLYYLFGSCFLFVTLNQKSEAYWTYVDSFASAKQAYKRRKTLYSNKFYSA